MDRHVLFVTPGVFDWGAEPFALMAHQHGSEKRVVIHYVYRICNPNLTCTFQLVDKPWSQVSTLFLPDFIAQMVQHSQRSSIFIEFANSRSRAFRESIFAHEKSPYEYNNALGGARTSELNRPY